jgi:hypothetical protein
MKNRQIIFEELVQNLSVEELKNYILQTLGQDEEFVDKFIGNFSINVDNKSYKEHLIKIKKSFINPVRFYNKKGIYSEEMSISEMLDKCYIEINNYLDEKNYTDAVRELLAILEIIGDFYENYDDLEGIIANECQKTINILSDIFKNDVECPKPIKHEAHKKIEELIKNSNYEDFDLGDLDGLLLLLSVQLSSLEEGLNLLNNRIENYSKRNVYIFSKIQLLHEAGMLSEKNKVIDDNIDIPDLRKYKIGQLIEEDKIEEAIELLYDGIKIAEFEHSHKMEIEWKDLLLDIYIEKNDVKNIINVAEDLFYNGYDPRRYFPILKKHSPPEDWAEILTRLLSSLREPKQYGDINNIKAWIFIKEEMWDPLWDLVSRGDLETVFSYEKYLKPHFEDKLLFALTIKIKEYAARSTETKHYLLIATVLASIRLYTGGNKIADDLIFEFYIKYANVKEFLEIIKGV